MPAEYPRIHKKQGRLWDVLTILMKHRMRNATYSPTTNQYSCSVAEAFNLAVPMPPPDHYVPAIGEPEEVA